MPPTSSATIVSTPAAAGIIRLRRMLAKEVLRHASSGPTPVRNIRNKPIGRIILLKNGGPTLILCPCTASDKIGKSVPQSTAKHAASSTRLLNRKLDSRETRASSLFSVLRWSRFFIQKNRQTAKLIPSMTKNHEPILDWAN